MAPRLTYANVMATLAFFVAVGGVSYAAVNIPEDSVGSKELKEGAVHTVNLHRNAVDERALKPNAVGPKSLQGNAVSSDQLAPDSVGTRELRNFGVQSEDLDPTAVVPRLFAHVTYTGRLGSSSSGVTSVNRVNPGIYDVQFKRDLHGCVAVASVGFGFDLGQIGAGGIAQASMNPANDERAVRVTVYRGFTFSDAQDSDFNLIVAC